MTARSKIRRLGEATINRIAAGEVVERPAAAVKELVENALDAGAHRIAITISAGGASLILVEDDGEGMEAEELSLAVERHATSKLPLADQGGDDLTHIATLGFRGEALPSIGAVARLAILSRAKTSDAHLMRVEGGMATGPEPTGFLSAGESGTRVEVRDLFFATPARLKFLKSARSESLAVLETVKRLAMARPDVAFSLTDEGRLALSLQAEDALFDAKIRRLARIMGRDFGDNAIAVTAEREGVGLSGFAGLPTYNRTNAQGQFLFVNGRAVRDRLLLGALKAAYADYLARDRHAVAALFLDCDLSFVDVNVHPAKAEVRFRDSGLVRGLIIGALKAALHEASHRTASTVKDTALAAVRPAAIDGTREYQPRFAGLNEAVRQYQVPLVGVQPEHLAPIPQLHSDTAAHHQNDHHDHGDPHDHADAQAALGQVRAQVHGTYIVAETADGIVIVDQHAAHERLVYERMKKALANGDVKRQALLIPEVVELDEGETARMLARASELASLGLVVEEFGPGAVLVREVPAALDKGNVKAMIRDLCDELAETESVSSLKERLDHVSATLACHMSVRSGRRLLPQEMDALLRDMEKTPHSGQCNHGRPTYVELKLADIERMFGRR